MAGRESDGHAWKYVHSFSPSPRSGLFLAASIPLLLSVSISLLLSVSALILFLNNALSSSFFQPILLLGLFFVVDVVQCLPVLMPSNKASGAPLHGNKHPLHLTMETPLFVVSPERTLAVEKPHGPPL